MWEDTFPDPSIPDTSPTDSTVTGSSWSDWLQKVAAGVVDKAATAQWVQPYETERMRLRALGTDGVYTEGQRNAVTKANSVAGINSTTLLLIGGAVVAFMLMKR